VFWVYPRAASIGTPSTVKKPTSDRARGNMESVDGALRFLQRQFASVAHEESQWNEERMHLQQQVKELEQQRATQEEAYKDALLRIKMLQFALRQERGRYLVSPAPVSSAMARKPEASEISRPVSATVVRSVDRVVTQSPADSPPASPKAHAQIYRADNVNSSRSPQTPKGMEITRPRMGSRTASTHESPSHAPSDASKKEKPAPISLAAKSSFRPLKLKVKLTSHMDGVRALAFHPSEPLLVSGSEDCTVKLWNLAAVTSGPPSQRTAELDAALTIRTHGQSVLSVAILSAENYPNTQPHRAGAFATSVTYEDYLGLKAHSINRAHDDAVWDLHAHPLSNVLFSAGADGIVRTWGVASELALKSELKCTSKNHLKGMGHNNRGYLVPTSVRTLHADTKTCTIGYTCGSIAHFDFHGEQLIQMVRANDVDGSRESRDAQVNQVVAHPTMPLVIAAHQDRRLRFYDMRAGECVSTIVAHQDAVSSVSIDSSGLYLATGGHDGSLRVWSVAERQCVFEQSAHRPKFGEAVHSVAYHPSRGFIATSGADSLVKIFQ
ncbi:TPA: hypothetical protein N0F65_006988, partial [Lagenidium giganteum]